MPLIAARQGEDLAVTDSEMRKIVAETLCELRTNNVPFHKVLLVVPDFTRANSYAGPIANMVYQELTASGTEVRLIPALGTHVPMTSEEIAVMYGTDIPQSAYIVHDWRNDVTALGEIPGTLISEWSAGKLDYPVQAMINRAVFDGYDLIVSIGQVVPHEVVGMASYTKNLMVGIGGSDMINKSHFLGASCGMEKIMGRAVSPVRKLFNYAVDTYLRDLRIVHFLTVRARDEQSGEMVTRGLFSGCDDAVFTAACALAQKVNLCFFDKAVRKIVVYLDPAEFKSTWLGNKAVYRTRMAIADGGELLILAPALREFGEDPEIDRLIRKYGYRGTPHILQAVRENEDLRANLGAAAHLIHGSSEGRFRITYCPGAHMTREEIEGVGFASGNLTEALQKYPVDKLRDGFHTIDGEEIFYISNPALGLWACRDKF